MDASPRAANTGALPSVLTSGATLSMLGHDCRDDCIRIGAFDARVRFIHRPVCPVPGSTGSLIVFDFARTDLPVLDRLRLLRDVNRCARVDHIRVLASSSSNRHNNQLRERRACDATIRA